MSASAESSHSGFVDSLGNVRSDSSDCVAKHPDHGPNLPVFAVVVPAYNEEDSILASVGQIREHLQTLKPRYCCHLVVVNDGSTDDTGAIVEELAQEFDDVSCVNLPRNEGMGAAVRQGISSLHADLYAVLDADLSYSPEHLDRMLDAYETSEAAIVLASPYMTGGHVSNVPRLRHVLSWGANALLSVCLRRRVRSATPMVRLYRAHAVHSMPLRCVGVDLNLETIYHAVRRGFPLAEVPAHLSWRTHRLRNPRRLSSRKLLHQSVDVLYWSWRFGYASLRRPPRTPNSRHGTGRAAGQPPQRGCGT